MVDFPASLLGGSLGAVLGILFSGQALASRIRSVRERIDAAVKDPQVDTAMAAAAELTELEREAKTMLGLVKALFGRR